MEKVINSVGNFLNNIASGISNYLYGNGFYTRPIGLLGKSYGFVYDHLNRNIGCGGSIYDGFGTPIGEVSDPYLNLRSLPWFFDDTEKNMYPNYLEYIRGVYNLPLSINSFETDSFLPIDNRVGVVSSYDIVAAYNGQTINPNGGFSDTYMGKLSNYYASTTLVNASESNSGLYEDFGNKSITNSLYNVLGLNNNTIDNLHTRFNFDENGRIEDIYVTEESVSPIDGFVYTDSSGEVYTTNYGNYYSLGGYEPYYDTLTEKSKSFVEASLGSVDLLRGKVGKYSNKYRVQTPEMQDRMDYLSVITDNNVENNGERYNILTQSYNLSSRELYTYAEKGWNTVSRTSDGFESNYDTTVSGSFNSGVQFGSYSSMPLNSIDDLINKTNVNFKLGKYRTLVSRFHTIEEDETERSTIQTAISDKYGMSHGRNLLKLSPTEENGYDNPYCRVWTYHHQYAQFKDLIRPLRSGDDVLSQGELEDGYNWNSFRSVNRVLGNDGAPIDDLGFPSGGKRLDEYGVINKSTGLVNITPIEGESEDKSVKTKKCMFSIENLAWKGMYVKSDFENGLSKEQQGAFGGRIMWFPPYDLRFSENVSVNWSSTSFVGRGENVYSYINTERSGTLHFKLIVDHPSIVDYWTKENDKAKDGNGNVDDKSSNEQTLLRFFAGCDVLSINPQKTINKTIVKKEEPKPKPNPTPKEKRTYDKTFTFFVFYPNNYSGVDDKPNSEVSAMEYLANGVGAQLYKPNENLNVENLPTTVLYSTDYGYEVRSGVGISTREAVKSEVSSTRNVFINTVNIDNNDFDLYTQMSNKKGGGIRQWYYRFDKRINEILRDDSNYADVGSFGLNSNIGYQKLTQAYTDVDTSTLYSFMDVFVALTDGFGDVIEGGLYDSSKVEELKEILKKYQIKNVLAKGVASSHGHKVSNEQLNKDRANSVLNWLKTKTPFKSLDSSTFKTELTSIGNVGTEKSVNALFPKLYRAAQVIVTYQVDELVNLQETENETFVQGDGDTVIQEKYLNSNNNTEKSNYYMTKSGIPIPTDPFQMQSAESGGTKSDDVSVLTMVDENSVRYDNENKFFTLLEKEDPFLHNLICQKVRYFDPAFHSTSPEGFNARLTFLQQCTRQGSTISSTDSSDQRTANNLAFGRPPILILRIGDFFHTKVIIDSMSINYEPLVWDLNTEGIGVQPMIADIDLSIKLLGGEDLSGPISRLQNALSFNYYSNSGVYDNRSEMAEFDEDGNIKKFKAFK